MAWALVGKYAAKYADENNLKKRFGCIIRFNCQLPGAVRRARLPDVDSPKWHGLTTGNQRPFQDITGLNLLSYLQFWTAFVLKCMFCLKGGRVVALASGCIALQSSRV